jgi:hypothetical protein
MCDLLVSKFRPNANGCRTGTLRSCMHGRLGRSMTWPCCCYVEMPNSRLVLIFADNVTLTGIQLVSNAAFIDRKIKYQVSPKCNIALKFLRMHLVSILAQQFRSKVRADIGRDTQADVAAAFDRVASALERHCVVCSSERETVRMNK